MRLKILPLVLMLAASAVPAWATLPCSSCSKETVGARCYRIADDGTVYSHCPPVHKVHKLIASKEPNPGQRNVPSCQHCNLGERCSGYGGYVTCVPLSHPPVRPPIHR